MLADTVAQMRDDGVTSRSGLRHQRVRRLLVLPPVLGGHRRRPGQGRAGRARDRQAAAVPRPSRVRRSPHADAVRAALGHLEPARRATTRLVFTAHSIPVSMAETAGPHGGRYTDQLTETAGLVHAAAAPDLTWDLVWQSRSGPPQVPWLEPDINDHLAALADQGVTDVVVSPIGFVSDHLEVIWDLDNEAADTAGQARSGLRPRRLRPAPTPGSSPWSANWFWSEPPTSPGNDSVRSRSGTSAPPTAARHPPDDAERGSPCPSARRSRAG